MNTKKLILEGNLENINHRIKMAKEDLKAFERTKSNIEKELEEQKTEYDLLYPHSRGGLNDAFMVGVPNGSTYTIVLTANSCGYDNIGKVDAKAATSFGRETAINVIKHLQAWVDKRK